jgi:hypothetical protein
MTEQPTSSPVIDAYGQQWTDEDLDLAIECAEGEAVGLALDDMCWGIVAFLHELKRLRAADHASADHSNEVQS